MTTRIKQLKPLFTPPLALSDHCRLRLHHGLRRDGTLTGDGWDSTCEEEEEEEEDVRERGPAPRAWAPQAPVRPGRESGEGRRPLLPAAGRKTFSVSHRRNRVPGGRGVLRGPDADAGGRHQP